MKDKEGRSALNEWTNCSIEVREAEVPPELQALANEKRKVLIETLADVDDVIADRFLLEESSIC